MIQRKLLYVGAALLLSPFAQATPSVSPSIAYEGQIIKPDGTPLSGAAAQFKIQIRTPDTNNCLMFEEIQTQNMSASGGNFSLSISASPALRTDITGFPIQNVFSNHAPFTFPAGYCQTGNTYTPGLVDHRNLVVMFKDETMAGWEPIPAERIDNVPFAIDAKQVSGYDAKSLVRVDDGGGNPAGNISPLSNTEYAALLALAQGSSTAYSKVNELRGSAVPAMSAGEVLGWNGSTWVSTTSTPGAGSIVTGMLQSGAVTGAKLDPAISFSTSGTIGSAISTTRDFKIYAPPPSTSYVGMIADPTLASSYTLKLPLNAGTNGQLLGTTGGGVLSWVNSGAGGLTLTGEVTGSGSGSVMTTVAQVGGLNAANVASGANLANAATSSDTANAIVKRDGSGNFSAVDVTTQNLKTGILKLNNAGFVVNIGNPNFANYTLALPQNMGSSGQVLTTDGSTFTSWVTPPTGSQWTTNATNGSNIEYMTGNVGIGTTAPFARLHTNYSGGGPNMITSQNDLNVMSATTNAYSQVNFANATSSGNIASLAASMNSVNTGGPGVVTAAYGSLNSVAGNGNVSSLYGTSNSVNTVGSHTNVYGSLNSVTATGGSSNWAYGSKNLVTASGSSISNGVGVYSKVTATNAYGLYIDTITGGTTYGVFQYAPANPNYFAGKVGIGQASSPSALLHLDITNNSTQGAILRNGSSGSSAQTEIQMQNDNGLTGRIGVNSQGVSAGGASGTANSLYVNAPNSGGLHLSTSYSGAPIIMYTGGGVPDERLRITSGGNVGIGTGAPSAKLDVNGTAKLGLSGTPFSNMGICTIMNGTSDSSGVTNACTTGTTPASGAAVTCTPASLGGAQTTWSAMLTGASGQVKLISTLAIASTTWVCSWVQP